MSVDIVKPAIALKLLAEDLESGQVLRLLKFLLVARVSALVLARYAVSRSLTDEITH
jgi:hypothetical protein